MRVDNNFNARLDNFLGISSGWDQDEFDIVARFRRRRGKDLGVMLYIDIKEKDDAKIVFIGNRSFVFMPRLRVIVAPRPTISPCRRRQQSG